MVSIKVYGYSDRMNPRAVLPAGHLFSNTVDEVIERFAKPNAFIVIVTVGKDGQNNEQRKVNQINDH